MQPSSRLLSWLASIRPSGPAAFRITLLIAATCPVPAFAALTWNSSGATDNWSTAASNTNWLPGNVVWTQNEDAIFDSNSGTPEDVTVSTAITFNNITFDVTGFAVLNGGGSFNLANDQASIITVTNAGEIGTVAESLADNIAGVSSLTKAGAGILVLGGTSASTYSGQTLVTAGILKTASATALGAGGAGAETIVSSGATLDVNAMALTNTETVRVAGIGVGGLGALVNNGVDQQNALNRVELTADATVGGTGRFDIRPGITPTLDLAGFTLTKVGTNQFSLVGSTVASGNIVITGGTLSFETTSLAQGAGTITVNNGGKFGIYGNIAGNVTRPITSNNGTIVNLGSNSTLNSDISMVGGSTIATGGVTSTFIGNITGSGPLAFTGLGAASLNGINTYTGGTTITDTRVQVAANTSAISSGPVTINGDGIVPDGQFYAVGAVTFANAFSIAGRGGNTVDTTQRGALRLENGATISGTVALTAEASVGSNSLIGTISGEISGNFPLLKVDPGTIVLSGANTYTGATTINSGTLTLDYSLNNGSRLSDSSALIFNGGVLTLTGDSVGDPIEAVASTTLNTGAVVSITRTSGDEKIALGSISRALGATLNLGANNIAQTTDSTVAGVFPSWLTIGGTSLATKDGLNNIIGVTYTDLPTVTGIITDGMDQVRITGAVGNVALGGIAGDVIDVNSITRSVAGVATIDTTGKTLRVDSGVVFSTTGSGGMVIGATNNGGNLTAGIADNTPALLDFNLPAGTVTVRSTITNNGSGVVSLSKIGAAELVLTGTNTYSGGTTLQGGILRVGNSDSALGNGILTVARNATLATASGGGARNLLNNVVLSAGATASVDSGYATLTLGGLISGSGSLATASSGMTVVNNDGNTFTGSTTIGANNTLSFTSIKNVADVTGSALGNPTTAALGTIGINNSGRLLYTGTGSTTDRVISFTGTTASATPTIDHSGTGVLRFNSAPTSAGAAIKILTLQGSTAGVGVIAGIISNNTATNTTAVTKTGTGTWSLEGTNTYTGGTTVNGGVLELAGNTANTAGKIRGTATVNLGGTLRISVNDATGYGTDATRLSVINLIAGELNVNTVANQTLGSAVVNMTGGSMTGIPGSNLDFFAGASALNTLASPNPSSIGGVKINLRQNNGVILTVADGLAAEDLVISSVISSSDGFTNNLLTKAGPGVLRLNAANTYTTGTSVNAGTLLVSNVIGSGTGTGAVLVTAGTLGGTGVLSGAVTVNTGAIIAPGASAGTLTTGAAIIDGSYACEIDGANADKLVVNGDLDIDGAALNVSLLAGGATQSGYVIVTYTGTRIGIFTGLPEGATVIPGYTISYATSGQIKLIGSANPFGTWIASYDFSAFLGADLTPTGDPDGDGQSNALEFALGGAPNSGSNNAKVFSFIADSSRDVDADRELLLTIAVRNGGDGAGGAPVFIGNTASQDGVTYTIQGSLTLVDGFGVGAVEVTPVTTGLAPAPTGYEYRTFSLTGSNGVVGKGFMRVRITP